jgi:hypothetical protein
MSLAYQYFNAVGMVVNPYTFKGPDQQLPTQQFNTGQMGDQLVSEVRGKYGTAAKRLATFGASAVAVTLPVNAASLVSVFTLYNPIGSGIDMELIDITVGTVLATTVVDMVGLYQSTAAQTALGTFSTLGTVRSLFAGGSGGKGLFYSAYTASGTPALLKLLGGLSGAVTQAGLNSINYKFDGSVIIPPGIAVHVAMTTAASTGSGITLDASWVELTD